MRKILQKTSSASTKAKRRLLRSVLTTWRRPSHPSMVNATKRIGFSQTQCEELNHNGRLESETLRILGRCRLRHNGANLEPEFLDTQSNSWSFP